MVIIRLSGGLGNQMFQYAFGLRLRSLGREVYFDDVSGYEHQEETGVRRPVQLGDVFSIDYPRADGRELRRLRDARMDLPSRLRRKLLGRSLEGRRRISSMTRRFLPWTRCIFPAVFSARSIFSR